jgi:hypothetical protein
LQALKREAAQDYLCVNVFFVKCSFEWYVWEESRGGTVCSSQESNGMREGGRERGEGRERGGREVREQGEGVGGVEWD